MQLFGASGFVGVANADTETRNNTGSVCFAFGPNVTVISWGKECHLSVRIQQAMVWISRPCCTTMGRLILGEVVVGHRMPGLISSLVSVAMWVLLFLLPERPPFLGNNGFAEGEFPAKQCRRFVPDGRTYKQGVVP